MAITIESTPNIITTASNPCVFVFSSDNTTQDAFSFEVELTVNGSVHSNHLIFVESGNRGKFNASEIIKSIVKSRLVTDMTLSVNYAESICSYSIRIIEVYGNPSAQQGSWVSSGTFRAFNGSLRHPDWIGFDYTQYDMVSTANSLFLTSFPRTERYYCAMDETMFISTVMSLSASSELNVYLYDLSGSVIASSLSNPLVDGYVMVLNVSPQSLIDNTSLLAGDFTSCYYYTVEVQHGSADTEDFKIYIDRECSMYDSHRLHWLNKFGVWDSYTFNKYSEESTSVKSNSYQIDRGTWSGSNDWEYNRYNGEQSTYSKTTTDKLKLNSDWIKQDKHNWLVRSLYESPIVYLEISYGVFELVNPDITSYTMKQRIKEGLISEVVTLNRTYTYTSQLN
jgi:hypothetical protein